MEAKLRKYVDELFAEAMPSKKAVELKEEMIQNLNDKYNDLISEGKTQEAAYNIAVAGIGDVSALLRELEDEEITPDRSAMEAARRRSGMFTSLAVMLYILSVLPIIILAVNMSPYTARIGVPMLFVMIAAATCILVYNGMTRPRFNKGSGTMVEEFREWQDGTHRRKSLRRAVSFALWSVILALYFVISFWTWNWPVTWIIFIIGFAIEAFINLFIALRK